MTETVRRKQKREEPPDRLLWSRRGDVLCERHAPTSGSLQFRTEGWQPIVPLPSPRSSKYQCQECHARRLKLT